MQVLYQLAAVAVTAAWSFFITLIFVVILDRLPFFRLRLNNVEQLRYICVTTYLESYLRNSLIV